MNPIHRPKTPALPKLWKQWQALTRDFAEGHVELTFEEFSPLVSTYERMRRHGVTFDPMLVALIDVLRRQVQDTLDDADSDDHDCGIECCETREDFGTHAWKPPPAPALWPVK